ncbi:MAG: hypothetical protein KAT00_07525 [Planctomycetes bacterium]|nr:hypothetical protein [Planctomycetota bacterium]
MAKILRAKAKIVRDNSVELDRMVKAVSERRAGAVYIGVLQENEENTGGSIGLAGIASVHEFGTVVKGSAFGDIVIPERSFIRSTMDAEQDRIGQLSERVWQLVMDRKISKFEALQRMGIFIKSAIQNTITTLRAPENAPATIALKGFDNPLIGPAPAKLQKSIDFVVREK